MFSDLKVVLILFFGLVLSLCLSLAWRYLLLRLRRREVIKPAQVNTWYIVLPSGYLLNPGPRDLSQSSLEGEFREL